MVFKFFSRSFFDFIHWAIKLDNRLQDRCRMVLFALLRRFLINWEECSKCYKILMILLYKLRGTFQKGHIDTCRKSLVDSHDLWFKLGIFVLEVFEIFRNEKEVFKKIECWFEWVKLFLLLILVENWAVVWQVDVLDGDFLRYFLQFFRLIFCAIGLNYQCSIWWSRIHFDLFTPVVLKAVEHLALIYSRYLVKELLFILGDLLENSDFILSDNFLQWVHVKVV